MPQYDLYVRRHDHAMQLVQRDTKRPVPIAAVGLPGGKRVMMPDVFIRPRGRISVFLMREEIHLVDEFPWAP